MTDERPHAMNAEWVVIGMMMALLGVILLLGQAGLVRAVGVWTLLPLILIGLGTSRMLRLGEGGRRHGGFLVFLGLWLLLGSLRLLQLWPLLLVGLGINAIWKATAWRAPSAAKSE